MKMHFSKDHYLCQEGECASPNTRFTHAFASEIDLKAHRSAEHMQALSKSQAREARTLDLEFNYANAPRRRERGTSTSALRACRSLAELVKCLDLEGVVNQ